MSAHVIGMLSVSGAGEPVRRVPGSGATSRCLPAPSTLEPPRDTPVPGDRGESPFHAVPVKAWPGLPAKARWLHGPKAHGPAVPAPPSAPVLPDAEVDPRWDR